MDFVISKEFREKNRLDVKKLEGRKNLWGEFFNKYEKCSDEFDELSAVTLIHVGEEKYEGEPGCKDGLGNEDNEHETNSGDLSGHEDESRHEECKETSTHPSSPSDSGMFSYDNSEEKCHSSSIKQRSISCNSSKSSQEKMCAGSLEDSVPVVDIKNVHNMNETFIVENSFPLRQELSVADKRGVVNSSMVATRLLDSIILEEQDVRSTEATNETCNLLQVPSPDNSKMIHHKSDNSSAENKYNGKSRIKLDDPIVVISSLKLEGKRRKMKFFKNVSIRKFKDIDLMPFFENSRKHVTDDSDISDNVKSMFSIPTCSELKNKGNEKSDVSSKGEVPHFIQNTFSLMENETKNKENVSDDTIPERSTNIKNISNCIKNTVNKCQNVRMNKVQVSNIVLNGSNEYISDDDMFSIPRNNKKITKYVKNTNYLFENKNSEKPRLCKSYSRTGHFQFIDKYNKIETVSENNASIKSKSNYIEKVSSEFENSRVSKSSQSFRDCSQNELNKNKQIVEDADIFDMPRKHKEESNCTANIDEFKNMKTKKLKLYHDIFRRNWEKKETVH